MISCMLVKLKIFGLGINKKNIIDIFKTPIYLKFSTYKDQGGTQTPTGKNASHLPVSPDKNFH